MKLMCSFVCSFSNTHTVERLQRYYLGFLGSSTCGASRHLLLFLSYLGQNSPFSVRPLSVSFSNRVYSDNAKFNSGDFTVSVSDVLGNTVLSENATVSDVSGTGKNKLEGELRHFCVRKNTYLRELTNTFCFCFCGVFSLISAAVQTHNTRVI